MDELKVKLSTKFMRGIISKLISRLIFKKMGYEVCVRINEIEVDTRGDIIHIHANVDAELDKIELATIINDIGMD